MRDRDTYPTGEKIKTARLESGIGVTDMAKELNVTRQTFAYMEKGQVDPKFSILQKFADATGKPINYFCVESSQNLRHDQTLINTGRNQGIIYACRQLAELFDEVNLARQLAETIGISIDQGRDKDATKLKELIAKK